MKDDDLVRMANQIAAFFDAYPHEEAVLEVANHIKSFWDPRMRKAIANYVSKGGSNLAPTARAAIERLAGAQA